MIRICVGRVLLDPPFQSAEFHGSLLLENCGPKRGSWQRRHQAEAPGPEMADIPAGHRDERPDASTVGRRRLADSLREQRAETAQTREADLHTHVGDRVLATGEQCFRELEPRRDAELMRCDTEHGVELTDEMKRRDAHLARQLLDRRRRLQRVSQQIASVT